MACGQPGDSDSVNKCISDNMEEEYRIDISESYF